MKSFRLRLTSLPYSVIIMENKKWRTGMADPELRCTGSVLWEEYIMKKRYLILAAIMITAITAVGCGKKKTEEPKQEAQATVTPAENTDTAGNDERHTG